MIKNKFLFSFLLVILLAAFVFSACRTKEPVTAKKDYTGVELTYYKVFDSSDIIQPYIDEFIKDRPGLKINYRQFADFDEYVATILNEMAEGAGPDLFSMQNTWFASNLGKIHALPENLGSPADFEKTYVDVAYKDLVHVDKDGAEKVFALPMTVDSLALYYNKSHFEDRIPSRGKPSSTWEGIKDDVVLLTKPGVNPGVFDVSGIALGRSENITRAADILYLLFLQYGVDFYNANIAEAMFAARQGSLGTYVALDALELFTSFADPNSKYYSWNIFSANRDAPEKEIEAFARGQVSMIVGYSYMYNDILNQIELLKSQGVKTIAKSDIRVAPIPQIEDPKVSSSKRVTYASYFAETVSRNSKYPDLAWEFVGFLASKKTLANYFDVTGKPTSRRDMIEDQKKDPIYGVFASQSGYAESFPIVDYARYKEIFTNVIMDANNSRASRASLLGAQELINNMLPLKGFVNKKVQQKNNAQK